MSDHHCTCMFLCDWKVRSDWGGRSVHSKFRQPRLQATALASSPLSLANLYPSSQSSSWGNTPEEEKKKQNTEENHQANLFTAMAIIGTSLLVLHNGMSSKSWKHHKIQQ